MKKVLLTALACVFSLSGHAAEFSSKADTRKYADKLMEHFVKKEFQVGLDDAKKYWPLPQYGQSN